MLWHYRTGLIPERTFARGFALLRKVFGFCISAWQKMQDTEVPYSVCVCVCKALGAITICSYLVLDSLCESTSATKL